MISNAYAQAAAAAPAQDPMFSFILIGGMFLLMYFLMIRPQSKKAKEHKSMVEALAKGDEVVALGMIGKIVKISDSYVGLEVSDGTVIHVQKNVVTTLLPKGTFNDITK